MFAEIPLAGNCEIKELKCDFFTDPGVPLEDDFTVIKKDNSSFCCCDPDVTIALCKHLFDSNPIVQPLIEFNSPGEDYWFFCRNEYCISGADETPFNNIFELFVEYGFIRKIVNKEFEKITAEGKDYIYVYSGLYYKPSSDFFTKFLELAKIDAKNIKDDLIDRYEYLNTDDEEDKETYLRQLKEIDEKFEDCLSKIDKGFEDSLAKL